MKQIFRQIFKKHTVLLCGGLFLALSLLYMPERLKNLWPSSQKGFVSTPALRDTSQREPSAAALPSDLEKQVHIDSLLVRLKAPEGFQISTLHITLHADTTETAREMESKVQHIRSDLIFFLTDKPLLVFKDSLQKQELEAELTRQLNMFLQNGQIKTVRLKQTALN